MEALRLTELTAEAILGTGPSREAESQPSRRAEAPTARVLAPDDLALAKRCVAGDDHAQRSFVGRYSRLVFSVCRRRGLQMAAAEDVTQEVFFDAFRHLSQYRGEARLSSWIFTLTCRRIATHYRREARQPVARGEPVERAIDRRADTGFEARFASDHRAAQARLVIQELDEPTRTVLLAYYVAELSVREIAAALDLPTGTVKSCLHRGRKTVRRRLEKR